MFFIPRSWLLCVFLSSPLVLVSLGVLYSTRDYRFIFWFILPIIVSAVALLVTRGQLITKSGQRKREKLIEEIHLKQGEEIIFFEPVTWLSMNPVISKKLFFFPLLLRDIIQSAFVVTNQRIIIPSSDFPRVNFRRALSLYYDEVQEKYSMKPSISAIADEGETYIKDVSVGFARLGGNYIEIKMHLWWDITYVIFTEKAQEIGKYVKTRLVH